MNVLGKGWQKMLDNWFDHTVIWFRAVKQQDETGQSTQMFEPVNGVQVRCIVGDRNRDRFLANPFGSGAAEDTTPILVSGAHPEIKVGWRAILDDDKKVWYEVDGVTPNQSADVTEIRIKRT